MNAVNFFNTREMNEVKFFNTGVMYIHKLSYNQIKELMKCYAPNYTNINITIHSDSIDVELIVDDVPENYVLHDFTVEVYDWDERGTDCLQYYRTKMLRYFGNQYAIDYLLG